MPSVIAEKRKAAALEAQAVSLSDLAVRFARVEKLVRAIAYTLNVQVPESELAGGEADDGKQPAARGRNKAGNPSSGSSNS